MKTFNYKTNKTVTFWFIDNNNVFLKEQIKEYNINLNKKDYIFNLNETEDIYSKNIEQIIEMLNNLESEISLIFSYEKYHKFDFWYSFQAIEKKKLTNSKNISKTSLNRIIWSKYKKQFLNLQNNKSKLSEYFWKEEHDLSRITEIVRVIRYIKWDVEKLDNCLQYYNYFWDNKHKKIALKNFWDFMKNQDLIELLSFYSKKYSTQSEEFKVALNPAILNTHTEVNQENWENDIEKLEDELKGLEEKNKKNIETKRKFEEELEAYINYILYENIFFKESKNTKYKEFAKEIFEKYETIKSEYKPERLDCYEKYVLNFIQRNWIKLNKYIEIPTKKTAIFIEQKWTYEELKRILGWTHNSFDKNRNILKNREWKDVHFPDISFIQLKTLLYRLTWERARIKEQNEKSDTKLSYTNLTEYIIAIKKEIQSRLKNENNLYWKFISIKWCKSTTAQKLSQKNSEYLQKVNFDKEIQWYSHFGFIVRKWERFFVKPFIKKDVVNKNQWFTFDNAEKLLENHKNEFGKYETYIFNSLTLKALLKLIFIKKAFKEVKLTENIIKIWKEKKYVNRKKNFWWKKNLTTYIEFLIQVLDTKKARELFPYLKNDFQSPENYTSLQEFEKDFLKNSYIVNSYLCDFDEDELVELNIVDRKFEYCENAKPRLKRQKDIQLFVKWFFDKIIKENSFDIIRMIPEIKIFIRYQRDFNREKQKERNVNLLNCNGNKIQKKIWEKERFYKTIVKWCFHFELNPLWIWKNPQNEQKEYLNDIIKNYKRKNKEFNITSIDIGENSFATCWVYDRNLKPKNINIEWEEKKILDLTDLKLENWKIIKKESKNSQKYKEYKYMFKQIILWQIFLKDILENIWEIEIKKENFQNIKKIISESFDKNLNSEDLRSEKIKLIKNDFPSISQWFKYFLFNYFKINYLDKIINVSEKNIYNDIFTNLELQKVIDFKSAFGSNFVWVIKKLFQDYPGIIVFESLQAWNTYNDYNKTIKQKIEKVSSEKSKEFRTFGTYVGMYIVKSLFSKFTKDINEENYKNISQYVYLDKNYENSIKLNWKEKYFNNGVLFFVDEKNTSKACPICNWNFIEEVEDDWKIVEKENINKLFWHLEWKEFENSMHHYKKNNWIDYSDKLEKAKKTENNACDYHMKNNPKWFDFIETWDGLATYNIAKKAKEYLEYLLEQS